jgi:hypothetical protein
MATSFINLKALSKRIAEVRTELTHLLHLESFASGSPAKKRGRPAKIQTNGNAKKSKPLKKRAKRGALGKSILTFLTTRGKEGAHINDIATHVGTKPANVTAWAYSTGKRKVKRVKPATYAIKG